MQGTGGFSPSPPLHQLTAAGEQRVREANHRTAGAVEEPRSPFSGATTISGSCSSTTACSSNPSSSTLASASASPSLSLTCEQRCTPGLIPLLESVFRVRPHLQVFLCNPTSFFFRSEDDAGWGCGYKNIQMVCSALLLFPLFRELLFANWRQQHQQRQQQQQQQQPSTPLGDAVSAASDAAFSMPPSLAPRLILVEDSCCHVTCIPSVDAFQGLIDEAHLSGFDELGREHSTLLGGQAWIGAVEAHILLCSYGVKSELIDFRSSHSGLMEYVWQYFKARTRPVNTSAHATVADIQSQAATVASTSSLHAPGIRHVDTHSHAFPHSSGATMSTSATVAVGCSSDLSAFVPPLYFQRHGHSLTIIGIVQSSRTSKRRLLVLDPDRAGGDATLLAGLQPNCSPTKVMPVAVKSLFLSDNDLVAAEYQLVTIASHGRMSAAEQQMSRKPYCTIVEVSTPQPASPPAPASSAAVEQSSSADRINPTRGAGGLNMTGGGGSRNLLRIAVHGVSLQSSIRMVVNQAALEYDARAQKQKNNAVLCARH